MTSETQPLTRFDIKDMFKPLSDPSTQKQFFEDHVDDNVDWITVNPLSEYKSFPFAGRVKSKQGYYLTLYDAIND